MSGDATTDAGETNNRAMLVGLTSDIVSAHVSNNEVDVDAVSGLISTVYGALSSLGESEASEDLPEPAVSIRRSVKKDHIVCLECGKKLKVLKRHLTTEHDMTTEEYRERWDLGLDYPLVAPEYAARRSTLAKELGLGRKPGQKRGRKKKA